MSRFLQMLENVFAAAAFAECGEWRTARMIAETGTAKPRTSPPPVRPPRPRMHA